MLSILSYVFGSSVCPPCKSVCSSPLPIFLIGLFVFLEWSHVSSLYILEIKPLSKVIIGKYVFRYGWFTFHFNAVFFRRAEAFYFDGITFIYSFLYVPCSRGDICEKYCCVEYLRFSCLCCPLGLLRCHDLYLSLLFTLNLFLCMV